MTHLDDIFSPQHPPYLPEVPAVPTGLIVPLQYPLCPHDATSLPTRVNIFPPQHPLRPLDASSMPTRVDILPPQHPPRPPDTPAMPTRVNIFPLNILTAPLTPPLIPTGVGSGTHAAHEGTQPHRHGALPVQPTLGRREAVPRESPKSRHLTH